jgi:hypothetical protein
MHRHSPGRVGAGADPTCEAPPKGHVGGHETGSEDLSPSDK